jgi:hypothetical protein
VLTRRRLPVGKPFTAARARAAGWSDQDLRGAVRRQELRRVCRAVYVRAEVPDSVLLRTRAHALLLGDEAMFSHATAAVILGSPIGVEPPHLLRVTLPPTASAGAGAGLRRGRRLLGPDDLVRVDGVQATSRARTPLDLAAEPDREEALVAVDALAHLWHHALPAAREQVRHLRGLRGLRQVCGCSDAASR